MDREKRTVEDNLTKIINQNNKILQMNMEIVNSILNPPIIMGVEQKPVVVE